ncbi:putative chemoreceptor glutamine deamidase CheD [Metapseudomonas resinovorans]|uniref:Probable chemoreceptor glutamine deamidase CheD n=1 Tax=Metapseudomonas resinovorans NBRC 106553 TaxID=1245471 RepID=S6ANF7_METRE|nr:putative chemoreceptor glutamine deamidase CheD [Pseudomonas resinovorans]BAN47118.1 putative chemoreceptor glutamine deamidase CheD [Pseudomonas resinovorans NBRC 106553]
MKGETAGAIAATRYFDPDFQLPAVKVLPGEFYATAEDQVLVAVLGSCIAVCLFDAQRGIGGMNHFLLPDPGPGSGMASAATHHGVRIMEQLSEDLLRLGARRHQLEAKVFGAGNLPHELLRHDTTLRTVEFIHSYLDTEGITLLAEDVMGAEARKVYVFPSSGKVLVKKFKSLHNDTILQRELEYMLYLKRGEALGPYDLFEE